MSDNLASKPDLKLFQPQFDLANPTLLEITFVQYNAGTMQSKIRFANNNNNNDNDDPRIVGRSFAG